MNFKSSLAVVSVIVSLFFSFNAFSQGDRSRLSGNVNIDGSSTVYPITEAVSEEFISQNPRVRIIVGVSGTGGGFKKFCVGETSINNASRRIKDSEKELAAKNGIEYVEFPIAYDGITLVVGKENNWLDYLSVEQINEIFKDGGSIRYWNQINPEWPNEKINIFSPGTDSGTFDYFREEIIGEGESFRSDVSVSEDDNVLVRGVTGDKYALGFFGFSYYVNNQESLRAIPVFNPEYTIEPVMPSLDTIKNESYSPLSRTLFIYVNKKDLLNNSALKEFVRYYLVYGGDMAKEVSYIDLPNEMYENNLSLFNEIFE